MALKVMRSDADIKYKIYVAKNFLFEAQGEYYMGNWIMQRAACEGLEFGEAMAEGSMRYTTITNLGPLDVYVCDAAHGLGQLLDCRAVWPPQLGLSM